MLPCAGHNASCYGEETVGFERLKAKCSCKVKCITDFQVKIMCYHCCCKTVVMFLCWQIFHENKIGCSQVRVSSWQYSLIHLSVHSTKTEKKLNLKLNNIEISHSFI